MIPLCASRASLVLAILVQASPPGLAAPIPEWTDFRGPEDTRGALGSQPFRLELDWRIPLGSGYSRPVAAGGRAVVAFAASDGDPSDGNDMIAAFDLETGDELWRARLDSTFPGRGGSQDGPVATPALAPLVDLAVMFTPRGHVVAFDLADGREAWRRDLVGDLGAIPPEYGFGSHPLVVDDRVIVQAETSSRGTMHAFDLATGRHLWSSLEISSRYQSPILAALEGREQILVVGQQDLAGLDAESGDVLWKGRHTDDGMASFAQPVVLPGSRILVTSWEGPARTLHIRSQVRNKGRRWTTAPDWTAPSLRLSYAVPAVRQDLVLGYAGTFLHALDVATGERVWRSRAPGGRGLTLLDGFVVVLDDQGEVVVGRPDRNGWAEVARASILDEGGYTPPSFGEGRILVRNLRQLAAVRIETASRPGVPDPSRDEPAEPRLRALVDFLQRSASPRVSDRAVATFLAEHETPLRGEHDREASPGPPASERVTFLWSGEAEDVALAGALLPEQQRALRRHHGTDLWSLDLDLPPGGAWTYHFVVDFGERRIDPANPHRMRDADGLEHSVVMTSGWEPPEWATPVAAPASTLETFSLESAFLDNSREITVYQPDPSPGQKLPLLLVVGLDEASTDTFRNGLDHGLASGILSPAIVAFVPLTRWQEAGYQETPQLARLIVEELVPALRRRLQELDLGLGVAIFGFRGGAPSALTASLAYPGAFNRAATFSLLTSTESEELLRRTIEQATATTSPSLRLEFTSAGRQAVGQGRSSHHDRKWLERALTGRGLRADLPVTPGAPDTLALGDRLQSTLRFLVPASETSDELP